MEWLLCNCASGQGEDRSAALLAHLGPQMMSFPIKIIGLDREQQGFDILFIQKYESHYYLETRSCLLEKMQREIFFSFFLSSGAKFCCYC